MNIRFKSLFLLLSILTATFYFGCEERQETSFQEGEKYIVLMHPTVANVRIWTYLTSNDILPVDPSMNVLGVYSENTSYNFTRTADFIEEEGLGHVKLMGLDGPSDPDNIFTENDYSGPFREIFEGAAGIIFFGGADIPPSLYGSELNLLTSISTPHRHYLELSFLYHLIGGYQDEEFTPLLEEDPEMPVLGLCLGMQTINVAAGGTLIQDIPTEVYGAQTVEDVLRLDPDNQHRDYTTIHQSDHELGAYPFHRIMIEEGTHLSAVMGEDTYPPYIRTSHHQAVDETGKGLYVSAWSMDGKVVEGIEHERYPNVIGVQFHPESITIFDEERKFAYRPGEEATMSYMELYPGEKGENFHRNFWVYFAGLLDR